jgi:hypothetical protein
MSILSKYEAAKQAVFDHVGYVENWRILPICDTTDCFWKILSSPQERGGSVRFADTEAALKDEDAGDYYEDEIYTQRHLTKYVYRGAQYTMVCVDTHTDGNQLLRVFDNTKERP